MALHHPFHLTLVVLTPSSQWHYYYHYYHLHDHSVCQLSVRTSSDSVDRVVYSFPFILLFTSFSLSLLLSLHSSYTSSLHFISSLPRLYPIPSLHHYSYYTLERLGDARPVCSPSHGRWHHICSQRVCLEHWLLRHPTPSSVYHINIGGSL